MTAVRFPDGFVWGAATAAYQVEGYPDVDGKGQSIWDTFTRQPGAIAGGDTADVACEQYVRFPEDIALLASSGLSAYRFSVSWPRIQPDGTGPGLTAGLDHYRRVVEACLSNGVTPWVTLYHWDLPQALQDRGGWPARETAERFAEYAAIVAEALGDTTRHWITVNEPKVASHAGYAGGIHAPGIRDGRAGLAAAHHLLLGHGLATRALREVLPATAQVGIALDLTPVSPASEDEADVAAARRYDGNFNRMFLEPVLRGVYPEDMLAWFGGVPGLRAGDLDVISAPVDFLGVNYYRPHVIRAAGAGVRPGQGSPVDLDAEQVIPEGDTVTMVGWPVRPDRFQDLLVDLSRTYPGTPLVVTENGSAAPDVLDADGRCDDPDRVAYLDGHLRAVAFAIALGADVRGYVVWTLLDNFEWAEGFAARFGVVHVDLATQVRTPKTSAAFLGAVARANALPS